MRQFGLTAYAVLILTTCLTACQYDDFCYTHPHGTRLNINTDWTEFEKVTKPTGMSVMVYPTTTDEGSEQQTLLSNELSHVEVTLLPGTYNVLTFNQSPSEYGSLVFENLNDYEAATVYAAETTSSWYTSPDTEPLVQEPEWIGADASKNHTVTEEMVEQTGGYAESITRNSYPRLLLCSMQPENLVQTIRITIHLKGVNNYCAARASLSGLAKGCRLATGERVSETATQLLEDWTLAQDPDNPIQGTITAKMLSFGLPSTTSEQSEPLTASSNTLEVTLLLVDEKTSVKHSFSVGDLLRDADKTVDGNMEINIDLTIDETLPDVKPADSDGNGGFNVDVNPWGKDENHEIDI